MIYAEMRRLTDEAIRLSLRQAENTALLAMAAHYAWLDACLETYRMTGAAARDALEQQARTRRLIRRGVAPQVAARELHVV